MKNQDEKILKLLDEVKTSREQIEKAEKISWKTDCRSLPDMYSQSFSINLHVESDISKLIGFAAFLMQQEKCYNEAASALNLNETKPKFKWQGFEVNDWMHDIKARIDKIQVNNKKNKLKVIEKRLLKVTSEELKAEMEIASIEEELKE